MQNSEIIMIIAILLAPVIAIQVQKWLETWQEKAERKKKIFYTLMATRATRISPEHVSALNMIDLEFEEETVCEKWREYVDYLNESPQMPSADATEQQHQE